MDNDGKGRRKRRNGAWRFYERGRRRRGGMRNGGEGRADLVLRRWGWRDGRRGWRGRGWRRYLRRWSGCLRRVGDVGGGARRERRRNASRGGGQWWEWEEGDEGGGVGGVLS